MESLSFAADLYLSTCLLDSWICRLSHSKALKDHNRDCWYIRSNLMNAGGLHYTVKSKDRRPFLYIAVKQFSAFKRAVNRDDFLFLHNAHQPLKPPRSSRIVFQGSLYTMMVVNPPYEKENQFRCVVNGMWPTLNNGFNATKISKQYTTTF